MQPWDIIREEDVQYIKEIRIQNGPSVTLSNTITIQATKGGKLLFNENLSSTATKTIIISSL